MLKSELIKSITDIANVMSDLIETIDTLKTEARRIERMIENLPSDERDIEEDESGEK